MTCTGVRSTALTQRMSGSCVWDGDRVGLVQFEMHKDSLANPYSEGTRKQISNRHSNLCTSVFVSVPIPFPCNNPEGESEGVGRGQMGSACERYSAHQLDQNASRSLAAHPLMVRPRVLQETVGHKWTDSCDCT